MDTQQARNHHNDRFYGMFDMKLAESSKEQHEPAGHLRSKHELIAAANKCDAPRRTVWVTPSPESSTIPVVLPEAYSDSTAWMATYMAGTLNVSNMICAVATASG